MGDRRLLEALGHVPEIERSIGVRKPGFFLDFDGTLAPIASRPHLVELPTPAKNVLAHIANRHLVCVVSGRGLEDLQRKIGLASVGYIADHGHRIVGPPGSGIDLEIGAEHREELEAAARELERRLRGVEGALVEAKGLSLSVHYRLVAEGERPQVGRAVAEVAERSPHLRLTAGKLVNELRPEGSWGKGAAVLLLLDRLGLGPTDLCPICLGDDLTDEDMFAAVDGWGLAVVVGDPGRPTRARYRLRDHREVNTLLRALAGGED
jgi:trehalose 6-phosphate phosphatase